MLGAESMNGDASATLHIFQLQLLTIVGTDFVCGSVKLYLVPGVLRAGPGA